MDIKILRLWCVCISSGGKEREKEKREGRGRGRRGEDRGGEEGDLFCYMAHSVILFLFGKKGEGGGKEEGD